MGGFNLGATADKASSEVSSKQWADYSSNIFGATDYKVNDTEKSANVYVQAPIRGVEPLVFYGMAAAFFAFVLWRGGKEWGQK